MSQLGPRIAMAVATGICVFTVYTVHKTQNEDRRNMRKAVLRDIEIEEKYEMRKNKEGSLEDPTTSHR